MRTSTKKVSTTGKKPTSVYLSAKDRRDLTRLQALKYNGLTGITTILREEGMARVREEIAAWSEKEPTS
jgi:hypothetical protein